MMSSQFKSVTMVFMAASAVLALLGGPTEGAAAAAAASAASGNMAQLVAAAHRKMAAMLFNKDLHPLLHEWKVSQLLRELGNNFKDDKLDDVKTLISLEKLDKSKCAQEKVYHEQLDKYPKDVPLHKYLKYVDNRMHEYCHTNHKASKSSSGKDKTTTTTSTTTTTTTTKKPKKDKKD